MISSLKVTSGLIKHNFGPFYLASQVKFVSHTLNNESKPSEQKEVTKIGAYYTMCCAIKSKVLREDLTPGITVPEKQKTGKCYLLWLSGNAGRCTMKSQPFRRPGVEKLLICQMSGQDTISR